MRLAAYQTYPCADDSAGSLPSPQLAVVGVSQTTDPQPYNLHEGQAQTAGISRCSLTFFHECHLLQMGTVSFPPSHWRS